MTLHEAKSIADVARGVLAILPDRFVVMEKDLTTPELEEAWFRLSRTRSNGGLRNSVKATRKLEMRLHAVGRVLTDRGVNVGQKK